MANNGNVDNFRCSCIVNVARVGDANGRDTGLAETDLVLHEGTNVTVTNDVCMRGQLVNQKNARREETFSNANRKSRRMWE